MTTNAIELVGIDGWIYSTLANDATMHGIVADRIYADEAPASATYPLVVFQAQDPGQDLDTPGFHHVWLNCLYLIRMVGQTASKKALQAGAERIHTLFQAQEATTADVVIVSCYRESPFVLPETVNGVRYQHLGGIYRIFAQPV